VFVENRQFEPTPPLFGAPVGGSPWNFADIFGAKKLVTFVSPAKTAEPTEKPIGM